MVQPALEMRDITVRFGGIVALNKVNLTLAPGGVHALIGPNGAGKTTLVSVLSGERRPSQGRVLLDGQDISGLSALRRARLGLTRTYQLTALFQNMSLRDNLLLSLVARDRPRLSLADLARRRDPGRHAAEVDAFLARFALEDKAAARPAALSHGDRRRLEIAMALASGPKVLLLDEPLAGLSTADAEALIRMIEEGIKGRIPILLIEHDMDAVFKLADEITVMVNGNVLAHGRPEAIRASAEVQAAYLSEEDDF
ncbi:branched-chain amino acid transport system ATP-binding protein [Paracoccus aminovorans]|uniref:Branched-chain amino acid transport system ATP-binding protein n=1 Tax=Paracoccus aminovorans TaxID=34004 RepID=A0A1I3B3I0_9RHOB|nr:ABC transporter ATP-binding protein [Paracoccus aminovorans]CQR87567.1 ABC-type branched-chain amino acid transport systems, ATPase component [Paracoccus aminovorans]SFH56865.1 branched-chain amino acid transport system ATP-binding protein [Paracoccus aminovorans]